DPAGLKALLDQLRSSEAWQNIANSQLDPAAAADNATTSTLSPFVHPAAASNSGTSDTPHDAVVLKGEHSIADSAAESADPAPTPSVASLLSQLQNSLPFSSVTQSATEPHVGSAQNPQLLGSPYQSATDSRSVGTALAPPPPVRRQDLRNCTFQQALPHLARLVEDPSFVDAISTMQKEQADLERQLWEERRAILHKHEEKVRVARTKASLIGSGLTPFEADMISDSFRKELQKFDTERALPAWDGLVAKQQARLESLGVPAMYPSAMKADREARASRCCLLPFCFAIHVGQCQPDTLSGFRTVGTRPPTSPMRTGPWNSPACPTVTLDNCFLLFWTLGCFTAPPSVVCWWFWTYQNSAQLPCPFISSPPTMPYVDLVSSDDYSSIWYTTNSPNGNVGGFDPAKPTIVMLHPLFLDSTWLHPQMDDPRLHTGFNIIIFDTRTTGKSLYRHSGRHDLWVTAADLAHCFHHLCLPPVHLFAPELYAYAALRFAALFPEKLLSLTLCNIPAQTEIRSVFEALEELAQLWSFSEDIESFEYSCKELLDFFAGQDAHPDLQDELVAYWEVHYPPFRRSYVIPNINLFMNRTPLTEEEFAAITCPTFIIQAERSQTHPLEFAEQIAQLLVNVPGGSASVFPVKASQGYLSIISASIVNQVFFKFLSRQPPARSDCTQPEMSLEERMRVALAQLGNFRGDQSFAERDPLSPLSFSCVTPEVQRSQDETYATYQKGERTAFSPLGLDGRPLRKFSERKDHWLDGGADGYSYSSKKPEKKKTQKPNRRRDDRDAGIILPPSEPVSEELQQVARMRRATINPSAVDKQVIKGSMAKVVATGNVPLPRLLR
ncbi:alpha/beta-hydrolase, partial [Wolfiporia cocos MD-104 SS10]